MAAVDRAILRVACFELLDGQTAVAVCVNEAVELAKRYGTPASWSFVNGILDAIARRRNMESGRSLKGKKEPQRGIPS